MLAFCDLLEGMGKRRGRGGKGRGNPSGKLFKPQTVAGGSLPARPGGLARLWVSRGAKAVWSLVGVVSVALSFVSLYPGFTVAVDAPLAPPDPLTAPFVVTYTGFLPLKNFRVSCSLNLVQYSNSITIAKSQYERPLGGSIVITSGESVSEMCSKEMDGRFEMATFVNAKPIFADIELDIEYSPVVMPWLDRHRRYPFWTACQSDGTLRWIAGRSPHTEASPPRPCRSSKLSDSADALSYWIILGKRNRSNNTLDEAPIGQSLPSQGMAIRPPVDVVRIRPGGLPQGVFRAGTLLGVNHVDSVPSFPRDAKRGYRHTIWAWVTRLPQ